MRINLRKTKPMKRDLVYTTDDWRLRPFDPTRVFAPSPHQNRQFAPPVEKVGLAVRTWVREPMGHRPRTQAPGQGEQGSRGACGDVGRLRLQHWSGGLPWRRNFPTEGNS